MHGSSRRVCLHTPQRLRNSLLLSRKRYGGHDIKTYVVKGTEWPGLPSPFYFFSILLSTTAGTRMEPLSTEWEKKREKKEKRADNDATVVSWPLLASKLARSRTSQTFPFLFERVTTNLSRCVLSYLRIHPGLAPSQGRAFDGGCVPVSAVPVFAQPPFVERNGGRPEFGLPSHRCRGVLLGSLLPFSLVWVPLGRERRPLASCWTTCGAHASLVGDAGPSFHSSTPGSPLVPYYQVPPAQRLRYLLLRLTAHPNPNDTWYGV